MLIVGVLSGWKSFTSLQDMPSDFWGLFSYYFSQTEHHIQGMLLASITFITFFILGSSLVHLFFTERDEYATWAAVFFLVLGIFFIVASLFFLALSTTLLVVILILGLLVLIVIWALLQK
ncbi:hypothetical protein V7024_21060 [Bacillus sp. JJ864]|uniref:hypothetical protein n=1 Tax=Bacillus sp. JJ864 TaxID=3122975 RepID=UPI002FFF81A5